MRPRPIDSRNVRRHRAVAAAAALLLPWPAAAAVPGNDYATALVYVIAGLVAGGAIGALFSRFTTRVSQTEERLSAAKSLSTRMAKEREATLAINAALPDGFIAWGKFGEIVSPALAHRLHLPSKVEVFADIEPVFGPAGFKRLADEVEQLHRTGKGFQIDLAATVDGLVFEAIGSGDRETAVVSFRDVTALRAQQRKDLALRSRLAEERDAVRGVLDAVPLPIWWRNRDLRLAGCNRRYAEMLEMKPADAVARGAELASPNELEQVKRLAAEASQKNQPARAPRRLVIGGERRILDVVETPLPGGALAGFGYDTTAEHENRAEMTRHLEANAGVMQNLSAALVIYGPDKRILMCNSAFARLWQLEESWLAGKPAFADVLERLRADRRLPEQADWQAFKAAQLALFKNPDPREEMLHLPDGRTIRACTSPHPLGGLVMTFEDTTNQLQLERARNTLIEVQRATLENLYEAVVVFGGDGRVDLFNSAFAKMWNLPVEMLAAKPHIDAVIDAAIDSGLRLANDQSDSEAMRGRRKKSFLERRPNAGRMERNDGMVVDYVAVPLPDGAMLYTYLDVTDASRIERALRERNEALQAADRLKSEFVANMSYELRTPLNTIMGFTEILENQYFGQLNDPQKGYTSGILDASTHLLSLISDILDLASIEAGQLTLESERFDVHAMLDSLHGLVHERAKRQALTLHLDCAADIGAIEADERRLKQVLLNLLNNALKFTPRGGTIWLGARRDGGGVALWVKDTGIGIDQEDQSRVFDKFWRSHNTASSQRGAGLGLALVRSFVQLHGGTVELDSSPQNGTTVTCRLPAAAAPAALPRAAS
jgi:signal transduction histidine kinase